MKRGLKILLFVFFTGAACLMCGGIAILCATTVDSISKNFPTPGPTPTPVPVTYEYTHNITLTNEGPALVTKILYTEAIARDFLPYQQFESMDASPENYQIFTGKTGWQSLEYEFKDLKAGESISIQVNSRVTANAVHFDLGDCTGTLPEEFLAAEEFIQSDDPAIQSLSEELSAGKTTPCEKVRAFYNYIGSKMQYELHEEELGAVAALKTLKGDCTEYSDLLIALSRAAGIPARRAHGIAYSLDTDGQLILPPSHQWAEVYFPGTGWAPVDPTWGHSGNTYFAALNPTHIMLDRKDDPAETENDGFFHYKYWFINGEAKVTMKSDWKIIKVP